MKGEVLIQNIFNLFIIAIILEASVTTIFSMTALKDLNQNKAVIMAREALVLLISLFLCYKVGLLSIFRGSGIRVSLLVDTIISALVLTRMTGFIKSFFSRIKLSD